MKKRLSSLIVVLAIFGAACASSGQPDTYDDAVRENFVEACVRSGEQSQSEGVTSALEATCTCAYEQFETTVAFEDFEAFDDTLRDNLDAPFPADFEKIFADCIRNAA